MQPCWLNSDGVNISPAVPSEASNIYACSLFVFVRFALSFRVIPFVGPTSPPQISPPRDNNKRSKNRWGGAFHLLNNLENAHLSLV